MTSLDRPLNMDIHRALGCALDAAVHINALQHSDAVNPSNSPRNLDAAKQALQGALYYLAAYESMSR